MAKKTVWILLCFYFYAVSVKAQTAKPGRKQFSANKISLPVKIDGNINELAWKQAALLNGFVEWRPDPGKQEDVDNRTEVYIFYSNSFIYVGGYCHEKIKDSISTEIVGRDNIGANDFIGIALDTYNDKINASGFYVTPFGEQYDAKYSNTGNEDGAWNAVWESEAKIVEDGWTFEMRIPYSALRFNSQDDQTWGVNITRKRVKAGKQYAWNPVDPSISGYINQEGEWTGITKIKPLRRLSFSPYFSTYLNHYPSKQAGVKDLTASVNGGMDVKYGINQSFTLDMTLIPDFGQVESDNQVLNLTPFEVKFNENRSFFTEGTELFNKGELFYSRRIGGTPLHYGDVQDTSSTFPHVNTVEHFVKNPVQTKLINATKISGRNKNGLGIGIFNAITNTMYAIVEDDEKHSRKIETSPITNYNIVVLDQSLKNNSDVALVNTNVWRSGKDYDANVTAITADIYDKTNIYNAWGKVSVSNLMNVNRKNITGYSHYLSIGKIGGRFTWALTQNLLDEKYDINDMGLLFNNNYLDHYLWIGYRWLKPKHWYNNIYLDFNHKYSQRFKGRDYQVYRTDITAKAQLKNLWNVSAYIVYNAKGNDFYEPHMSGRVYRMPQKFNANISLVSNSAKKYYYSLSLEGGVTGMFNSRYGQLYLSNGYRFNNKLSLTHSLTMNKYKNDAGFADIDTGDIIFSRRDRKTVENVISGKYNFSKLSGITLRVRHYWSEVLAKEYFSLLQNGMLSKNDSYTDNRDQNYNAFTIDMVYTWQFAPGSFLNVVWKNSIYGFDRVTSDNYYKNLGNTLGTPQNNNVSLKLLYYLDYLQLKNKS